MKKMFMTVIGMAIVFCAAAVIGCTSFDKPGATRSGQAADSMNATPSENDTLELQGTVVYKDFEGGFFAIESDDGRTYDPINLPDAFKKNGLPVTATVRLRENLVGFHMVGKIVEIISISER